MRRPNPARPNFQYLEPQEILDTVRYALLIVEQLAREDDYAALELFQECNWRIEQKAALWSCFNSQQKSILGSLIEADRDFRERRRESG